MHQLVTDQGVLRLGADGVLEVFRDLDGRSASRVLLWGCDATVDDPTEPTDERRPTDHGAVRPVGNDPSPRAQGPAGRGPTGSGPAAQEPAAPASAIQGPAPREPVAQTDGRTVRLIVTRKGLPVISMTVPRSERAQAEAMAAAVRACARPL